MEDKITFLGTGGGRIVVANQLAATGGFVINIGSNQIHVDPGPGALVRARQFGVKESNTNVIFVSHSHLDHANDLNAVIDAMTLGGIHEKGTLVAPPSVIDGTEKEVAWLRPFYKKHLHDFFSVKPGDVIKLGDLEFTATKTEHDEEGTIGFVLKTPNSSIGYTADTTYFDELPEIFKDVQILILNVLRPRDDRWKTHLCSEDVVKILTRARPELAIINHFGAKMIKFDPIHEARLIQQRTGVRTMAATDGMKINLKGVSFSV